MKKRISLVLSLALMLSVALTACGSSDQVDVAKGFMDAFIAGDAEKVVEYCTEEFKPEASLAIMAIGMAKSMDEEFSIEASGYELTEENEDTATVTFTVKTKTKEDGEQEDKGSALLKKVDGKWLVNGMN